MVSLCFGETDLYLEKDTLRLSQRRTNHLTLDSIVSSNVKRYGQPMREFYYAGVCTKRFRAKIFSKLISRRTVGHKFTPTFYS